MQLVLLHVGKPLKGAINELISEYCERIQAEAQISIKLLPPLPADSTQQQRAKESNALLAQIKPTDTVVLLDERGQQQNNLDFARTFEQLGGRQGRLVFVVGGAFGVDDSLRLRADFVWSLSKLVLPHQLALLVLVEQLYRTLMIKKDHPYHHQ